MSNTIDTNLLNEIKLESSPKQGSGLAAPITPQGKDLSTSVAATHYAQFGQGGYRTVKTYSDLDNISTVRLELGMMVNVINDSNINNNGLWILGSIDSEGNKTWRRALSENELTIGNDAQTTSKDGVTEITTLGSSEIVAGTRNVVSDKGWFVDAVYPVYENNKWIAYVHLSKTYPKTSSTYKEESAIPTFNSLSDFIAYCEGKDTEIFTESFTKLQSLVTSNNYNNVLLNWVPREGSRSVFETKTNFTDSTGKVIDYGIIYPSSKLVAAASSYTDTITNTTIENFIKNNEVLTAQCNGCLKLEAPDENISNDLTTGYGDPKLNVIKVSANKDKQFLNKLATYKAQFTYSPDTYYDIPNYFFAYIKAYAKDASGNITGPFPPAYSSLVDKKAQPQFFEEMGRGVPNAKTISVLGNTTDIGDLQIFTDNYTFGVANTLSGTSALTVGKSNKSYQSFGLTAGVGNTNTGYASAAIGNGNNVSAEAGAAIGYQNNAYSLGSIALGRENSAGDPKNVGTLCPSVALGYQSSSFAKGGIAAGFGLKSGTNDTPATDGQAVFGRYNKNNLDNVLEVGIGKSNSTRKNALEIDTNGNLTLDGNATIVNHDTTIINDTKAKNSLLPCNFSGWYFSGFGGTTSRMFLTNVQLSYEELKIIFNETTLPHESSKIVFDYTKDSHKELFNKIKNSKISNTPKQGPFFINEFGDDIVPLFSDFSSGLGAIQLPSKLSGLKFQADGSSDSIALKPETTKVTVSEKEYTITKFVTDENIPEVIIDCNYTNIWSPRYEQTKKGVFLDAKNNKYTFYTGNILNFKLFVGPEFKTDVCNIKSNDTFGNQVPTVTYKCGDETVTIPMGYVGISNLSSSQTIKLKDNIDLFKNYSGDITDKPFMYGLYIDTVTSYRYYTDNTTPYASTIPAVVNLFRNYSGSSFLKNTSEISDVFIKTEKQSTLEIGSDFIDKPYNSDKVTVNKLSATQYGFRFASKIQDNKNNTYSVAITSNVAQVPNDLSGVAILAKSPDDVYVAEFECGLSAGDRLTIKNDTLMQDCATITGVDGNIITYEINSDYPNKAYIKYINGTAYATDTSNPKSFHDLCLWCPLKPDEGYVLISENAISTGIGNKVSASSAFVTGRENIVYGDYSIAAGRNNSVGYASISVGQQVSTKYYSNCAAFGRGLQVGNNNQTVVGKFNKVNDSIFAVGNGSSGSERSNAFEVTTSGLTKANGGLTVSNGKLTITDGYLNLAVYKENSNNGWDLTDDYGEVKLVEIDGELVLNITDTGKIASLPSNVTVNNSIEMQIYDFNTGKATANTASLQCVQLGEGDKAQYSLRVFR